MLILLLRMASGRGAMNSFKIIFLGFLSLCGLTACNDAGVDVTGNEDTPKIFLREKPRSGQYVFPEALFVAELRIVNGCVHRFKVMIQKTLTLRHGQITPGS